MSIIKHGINSTSIFNVLYTPRCNIRDGVYDQMDDDLWYTGWDRIVRRVEDATPASIDEDCIIDIMRLL